VFAGQLSALGGPGIAFNNSWEIDTLNQLPDGSSLSGFKLFDSSVTPLVSAQWFVFAYGASYSGADCFNCSHHRPENFEPNPGFSGIATFSTPLPAALPLFATGLGALGLLGWRRKRKAQAAA